jgi:hypothetical protein
MIDRLPGGRSDRRASTKWPNLSARAVTGRYNTALKSDMSDSTEMRSWTDRAARARLADINGKDAASIWPHPGKTGDGPADRIPHEV